jgi:hypothetical protein
VADFLEDLAWVSVFFVGGLASSTSIWSSFLLFKKLPLTGTSAAFDVGSDISVLWVWTLSIDKSAPLGTIKALLFASCWMTVLKMDQYNEVAVWMRYIFHIFVSTEW